LNRQVQRRAVLIVLIGRSLLAGLVRPVPVVMAGVLAEYGPKVGFLVDQHPVGALGPCGAYPSLGMAVRPWCPRRGLDYPHALAGEDLVEGAGESGVAVPDEEAERAGPVAEVHEEVAGLLRGPGAVRVGGHSEDVHVPGAHLHHEQHVQAPEEDRVDMEEVAGQQPVCLCAQERPPGGVQTAGCRPVAPGAQDPPHGRLADLVPEPGQLAVHPAVPPGPGSPAPAAAPGRGSAGWSPAGPAGCGHVPSRLTGRGCRASTAPGVTSRWQRSTAGSSRASAARTARSAQAGFGRATWRRSTVTS